MAWSVGASRTTGDIITAANWNNYMGAGGNHDHLFNGTRINADLIYELSLAISNGPIEGAALTARAAATGGMTWVPMHQQRMYWIGR